MRTLKLNLVEAAGLELALKTREEVSVRSWKFQVATIISWFLLAVSAQAKPPVQIIEMDGKPLSEKESLELIYHRTDYDVLVDFKEIRLNGKVMDSIILDRDRYLTVLVDVGEVEEVRSGRNRKIKQIKLEKMGLICTDKILSVQGDFHLKPHVRLVSGSSVIFKIDDSPLQESGNLIKLFVCPPNPESLHKSGPSEHLPPPSASSPSQRRGVQ